MALECCRRSELRQTTPSTQTTVLRFDNYVFLHILYIKIVYIIIAYSDAADYQSDYEDDHSISAPPISTLHIDPNESGITILPIAPSLKCPKVPSSLSSNDALAMMPSFGSLSKLDS